MRTFKIAAVMFVASLIPGGVLAQPAQQADPEKQALAFEVQECLAGKVRATTQALTIQAQVEDLKKKLQEAEARAKAAEEKPAQAEQKPKE